MTIHFGDVSADRVLYIPFASYGANGESITLTGLAVGDVEIFKNGGTTQRAGSDSGIALLDTDGIDFDGITGIHGFSIDLQDDTDAGFYSVGDFYWVIVSAVTINAQTVNFIAATFRIVAMEGVTGFPKADVGAIRGDEQSAIDLKDFADAGYDPGSNKVQGVVLVDTTTTNTDMRGTDSAALASVCTEGRLAELDAANLPTDVAAVKTDTGNLITRIPAALFSGITSLAQWLGLIAGKQTGDATARTELRATGAGSGTYDETTDSQEAVKDAGVSVDLATFFSTDTGETYASAVAGSVVKEIADNAGGSALTEAGIADAVWDEATAGHVAAGSFGKLSADVLADTNELQTNQNNWLTATGFSTHSAADVWAVGTRVLTAGTNIVLAKGTGVTGFNDITAAAVVTAMGTGTFLTAIPWNASWDTEVQSEVVDALQETIPDTVPADGSRPNMQQAARMALNTLIEFVISGTTYTVKKEDGSTTLFTMTLNDATTPTGATRAS